MHDMHDCFEIFHYGTFYFYFSILCVDKEKTLVEEVNKLYWMDINENFFDKEKFAGEGNIGHMLCQVNINKKQIFEGD